MTRLVMKRFLLDTGMLLGLILKAPYALQARSKFNFEDIETMIFTSIVCRGELLALAEKRGWGQKKRRLLEEFLDKFPTVDINQESILNSYALIDAWSQGRSVDYPEENPFPPPKPAVRMSKNDLWIAATAHVSNSVLLSTDKDFLHLNNKWISFVYIDPKRSPS